MVSYAQHGQNDVTLAHTSIYIYVKSKTKISFDQMKVLHNIII